jgi:hypothetical protein
MSQPMSSPLLDSGNLLNLSAVSIALVAYTAVVRQRLYDVKAKVANNTNSDRYYLGYIRILTVGDVLLVASSLCFVYSFLLSSTAVKFPDFVSNSLTPPEIINKCISLGLIIFSLGLILLVGLHFYEWGIVYTSRSIPREDRKIFLTGQAQLNGNSLPSAAIQLNGTIINTTDLTANSVPITNIDLIPSQDIDLARGAILLLGKIDENLNINISTTDANPPHRGINFNNPIINIPAATIDIARTELTGIVFREGTNGIVIITGEKITQFTGTRVEKTRDLYNNIAWIVCAMLALFAWLIILLTLLTIQSTLLIAAIVVSLISVLILLCGFR